MSKAFQIITAPELKHFKKAPYSIEGSPYKFLLPLCVALILWKLNFPDLVKVILRYFLRHYISYSFVFNLVHLNKNSNSVV